MKAVKRHLMIFAMILLLTGCAGQQQDDLSSGGGGGQGYLGDTLHTYWFDFSARDAYLCDLYEGHEAPAGYSLLVVTLTLENTFDEAIPMGRGDFQIQWGEGDEDFDYPIPAADAAQLPDDYTLAPGERREGLLVYEVPSGCEDFSLAFLEVFETDEEGDGYFIDFTVTSGSAAL